MASKKLPRRKRLMIRYSVSGLLLVFLVGFWVFWGRLRSNPYTPGEEVEGITRSLDRAVPDNYHPVSFANLAGQAGIDFVHFGGSRSTQLPEDMGSGAAWGDYDGDGDLDLYVCNIAGPLTENGPSGKNDFSGNRLYRNNGNGTFSDVTGATRTGYRGCSMGAAWADYDGDGDLDLLVTNFGVLVLYRNDHGVFTDVSKKARLQGLKGFWTGASWADYDRDGDLDVYICGYVQYKYDPGDRTKSALQYKAQVPFTLNPSSYSPERNLLYRNDGDGTFTEVARAAGVDDSSGRSLSAAWCDFDDDGWIDLYVANDISDNAMFKNLGHGKFTDVSYAAWVADYRGAMGLALGDWDNDSDTDIFVTHWIAQENALYSNLRYLLRGTPSNSEPMRFRFMDLADQVGLGQIALDYVGWGTSFFDFDNDGRQDLLVVNGSTFQDEEDPRKLVPMKDLLFWNGGDEDGFFEVGRASGEVFDQPRVGRGAAFADFDDDGDVDVFVVNHGDSPFLLVNQSSHSNRWLKVRLRGSGKNLYGVGAKIEIRTGEEKQMRRVGSQPSYLSQNPYEVHFGLGGYRQVDELEVTFPSGKSRKLYRIPSNQTLIVSESKR